VEIEFQRAYLKRLPRGELKTDQFDHYLRR
jgi:hypothetical protein